LVRSPHESGHCLYRPSECFRQPSIGVQEDSVALFQRQKFDHQLAPFGELSRKQPRRFKSSLRNNRCFRHFLIIKGAAMSSKEKPIEAPHDNKRRELRNEPFSPEAEEKTLLSAFKRLKRWVSIGVQRDSKPDNGRDAP
jgi:hypothetical protein